MLNRASLWICALVLGVLMLPSTASARRLGRRQFIVTRVERVDEESVLHFRLGSDVRIESIVRAANQHLPEGETPLTREDVVDQNSSHIIRVCEAQRFTPRTISRRPDQFVTCPVARHDYWIPNYERNVRVTVAHRPTAEERLSFLRQRNVELEEENEQLRTAFRPSQPVVSPQVPPVATHAQAPGLVRVFQGSIASPEQTQQTLRNENERLRKAARQERGFFIALFFLFALAILIAFLLLRRHYARTAESLERRSLESEELATSAHLEIEDLEENLNHAHLMVSERSSAHEAAESDLKRQLTEAHGKIAQFEKDKTVLQATFEQERKALKIVHENARIQELEQQLADVRGTLPGVGPNEVERLQTENAAVHERNAELEKKVGKLQEAMKLRDDAQAVMEENIVNLAEQKLQRRLREQALSTNEDPKPLAVAFDLPEKQSEQDSLLIRFVHAFVERPEEKRVLRPSITQAIQLMLFSQALCLCPACQPATASGNLLYRIDDLEKHFRSEHGSSFGALFAPEAS